MYHYKCKESIRMFRILSLLCIAFFFLSNPFTGCDAERKPFLCLCIWKRFHTRSLASAYRIQMNGHCLHGERGHRHCTGYGLWLRWTHSSIRKYTLRDVHKHETKQNEDEEKTNIISTYRAHDIPRWYPKKYYWNGFVAVSVSRSMHLCVSRDAFCFHFVEFGKWFVLSVHHIWLSAPRANWWPLQSHNKWR